MHIRYGIMKKCESQIILISIPNRNRKSFIHPFIHGDNFEIVKQYFFQKLTNVDFFVEMLQR